MTEASNTTIDMVAELDHKLSARTRTLDAVCERLSGISGYKGLNHYILASQAGWTLIEL